MNDSRSFERFVADNVAGEMGGVPLPEDFYDDMHTFARHTRQRPGWLALTKEPPMRISDTVAVGSPTVRALAILAATLLIGLMVAGAGLAGSRLLAADAVIVVDQTPGAGDYTTINDAVAAAEDGDTILVRDGIYEESVIIRKAIEIVGNEADRSRVTVQIPTAGPTTTMFNISSIRYAFRLEDADASLSNVTIRGPGTGVAIVISGGAPTIEGITVELDEQVGLPYGSAFIGGGAGGTFKTSDLNAFLWLDEGATIDVIDNVSTDVIRTGTAGTAPMIVGNTARGIWAHAGSTPTVEGNTVQGTTDRDCGLESFDPDTNATFTNNTVIGHDTGICVGHSATVAGNVVQDNQVGIRTDPSAGEVALIENTVTGNVTGLQVWDQDSLTLRGNVICQNDVNVLVQARDVELDTSGNEICPNPATE